MRGKRTHASRDIERRRRRAEKEVEMVIAGGKEMAKSTRRNRHFKKTDLSIHQRTIKLIARYHASASETGSFFDALGYKTPGALGFLSFSFSSPIFCSRSVDSCRARAES